MKLSWGLTFSSLYCAASAAREAHVYIHDAMPGSATQASSLVTPETARLIFARRLGLSRFHTLDNPSKHTIHQLNVFGGRQPKLLGGDDKSGSKDHEMLWLEDVEDVKEYESCFKGWSSFTISNPPSTSDNDRLLQDMTEQARSLSKNKMFQESHSGVSIPNEWLTISHQSAKDFGNGCSLGQSKTSVTVVLMPPSSPNSKRSVNPYGTYALPSSTPPSREPKEALLSLAQTNSKPVATSDIPADLEDFPVITAQAEGNSTKAPLGILKRCYATKDACTKATNSCSGHGSCDSPNRGDGEANKQIPICFSCRCKATVSHHDGKGMESSTKTTYWGGPACQKKDVSVPFWLLVGTTVLLVFLISSGIGLMYSMGSEELPSVIGAGVSGPSRK